MTDAIVAARKKEIDDILEGVRKESEVSVFAARYRLVMMASSINRDAIMGLMVPNEGITEDERIALQEYNRKAHERLRV